MRAAMSSDRRRLRQEARQERRTTRRKQRVERREVRRRRAPEVARQLILAAAERVFATARPHDVGLKEVAGEAGVSHALITHYFGTYAGLIETVLQHRLERLRETMVAKLRDASALSRPEELLDVLFHTLDDPVHLRLMKWMVATERVTAMHAFALQQQGLTVVAHEVAHAVTPAPSKKLVETITLALLTAVAAALGYSLAKQPLSGALGKEPSSAIDAQVRKTLAGMLESYLRDALAAEHRP
jgi:AcrR family transcriptional regulator